jgi:hypothetical protein
MGNGEVFIGSFRNLSCQVQAADEVEVGQSGTAEDVVDVFEVA